MELTIFGRQNHGTGPWLPVPATIRGTLRSLPGIHSTDGAVVSDQAGQDRSNGPQSWNPNMGPSEMWNNPFRFLLVHPSFFYFGNPNMGVAIQCVSMLGGWDPSTR